ncbi:hypothetical protein [Candidatus Symbiopectobacterium sp.]|uniref:hypothetical protein n=1 Tax=Candidatus Symbiopectobacterium sp. TaxID=2816440 RepID=UPI0025BD3BCA|nr:hypothetical protein [Candidatus Symbiopectobacterium sp.]
MLNPERGDASRSDQHFNPKQACHNSIIPYYSTKPCHARNHAAGQSPLWLHQFSPYAYHLQ